MLMKPLEMKAKLAKKIKGGTYKMSIISAVNCRRVLNLELKIC